MSDQVWIAEAHRDNGKRFIARADETLTALVEFECAIRGTGYKKYKTFLRLSVLDLMNRWC
jgi:serine kinase of HPr protein (carbohydrate metabolism regulator)